MIHSKHTGPRASACLAAAFLVSWATGASAATFVVTATDSGFVTPSGSTDKFDGLISPATGNYQASNEVACTYGGLCAGPYTAMPHKNYFVFDLSGITGTIVSATLELFNPVGGYEGPDPFETYVVSATDPMLMAVTLGMIADIGAVPGTGAVDDGCGNPTPAPDDPLICEATALYGTLAAMPVTLAFVDIASGPGGTLVTVPFTPAGIAYLGLFSGSSLALGGALSTATPGPVQSVFSFTSAATLPAPTLVIETAPVPLPAAAWLTVSALMGLTALRRKVPGL